MRVADIVVVVSQIRILFVETEVVQISHYIFFFLLAWYFSFQYISPSKTAKHFYLIPLKILSNYYFCISSLFLYTIRFDICHSLRQYECKSSVSIITTIRSIFVHNVMFKFAYYFYCVWVKTTCFWFSFRSRSYASQFYIYDMNSIIFFTHSKAIHRFIRTKQMLEKNLFYFWSRFRTRFRAILFL